MNDLWEWATSFEWWQYFLAVYACGYVVTVFIHMDTFLAVLPRMRKDREFADAESGYPRLTAGVLALVASLAALFWPLEALRKSWWRGLVTDKRTLKIDDE